MAKRLDQIIVVDVEATCWPGGPPPGEEPEIIEVGLCVLDVDQSHYHGKRSILVRPERSTLSDYCTQLTTLTMADLEQGVSFAEACDMLRDEYAARKRAWASFGDYDRRQFARQCQREGIPYPFGKTHINVKNLAALAFGFERERNLAETMAWLGWSLEGTWHRGADDAWNVARLLALLLARLRHSP